MGRILNITMPDLGEGVVEGELEKWKVSPGDMIREDDIVAEVMTDKASMEVPSSVSGVVKELKVQAGESCPVGHVLLTIEEKTSEEKHSSSVVHTDSKLPDPKEHNLITTSGSQEAQKKEEAKNLTAPADPQEDGVLALPMVRKKAQEHGLDLTKIQGTGLAGRVTLEDLQKWIPKKQASAGRPEEGFSVPSFGVEERKPLRGVRKKIADTMQASKRVIPHFTLMEQADVSALFQLKARAKKLYPEVKVTYLSFVMKMVCRCLKEFPAFNASIDDETNEIVYKKYFHLGFAADTPKGLLVPVIKNVDQKNILQISREIVELAEKARSGKIAMDDMKGASITITNIGSLAGLWATPIINPPEVCILGMYRMFERPVWKGEAFYPAKTMNFSVTSDHRLIDGAEAARFISFFVEQVENPSLLLIEN